MKELVNWTPAQLESREPHPLLVITIFVVIFLQIHPFQDGNGKLSRALPTLLLLRSIQKQKVALEKKLAAELAVTSLPKLSVQIIDHIKGLGPASVAEIVGVTGANRNTVKAHFKTFVNNRWLEAIGAGRGARYRLKRAQV